MSIVVSYGDCGQIGEEGEENDELRVDCFIDNDHGRHKVDLQVKAQCDTILNVRLHPLFGEHQISIISSKGHRVRKIGSDAKHGGTYLEDLPGNLDSGDNGAQAGSQEDTEVCS